MHVALQLAADHGELGERGVQDALLQTGMSLQSEAEDGDEDEQQWEQRQEAVVRDQTREAPAVVLTEFLDHGQREAEPAVSLLISIQRGEPPGHAARSRPGHPRRVPAGFLWP